MGALMLIVCWNRAMASSVSRNIFGASAAGGSRLSAIVEESPDGIGSIVMRPPCEILEFALCSPFLFIPLLIQPVSAVLVYLHSALGGREVGGACAVGGLLAHVQLFLCTAYVFRLQHALFVDLRYALLDLVKLLARHGLADYGVVKPVAPRFARLLVVRKDVLAALKRFLCGYNGLPRGDEFAAGAVFPARL